MMDFRQLRYFVKVADELHMGRAAKQLKVAQPALSQQIKLIESRLGLSLFTRGNRRLGLTEAGQIFLNDARAALEQTEHAVKVAGRAGRGELGRLEIGLVDSAMYASSFLALLEKFHRKRPGVELELHSHNVVDQISMVKDNEIDLGVARGPLPALPDGVKSLLLQCERPVVAMSSDHQLALAEQIEPEALENKSLITAIDPAGVGLSGYVTQVATSAGITVKMVQRVTETSTMLALVAAGLGVSILPESLSAICVGGVTFRPLTANRHIELHLIYPALTRRPVVKAFLDACRKMPSATGYIR